MRSFEDSLENVGIFSLKHLESVGSTNDVIKQAIDDERPEGFAVRADIQTGGYGRYGRSWSSDAGGLYLSALLRPFDPHPHLSDFETFTNSHCVEAGAPLDSFPPFGDTCSLLAKLPTLSLVVGIAVKRVLDGYIDAYGKPGVQIMLKWPNDVVVVFDDKHDGAFSSNCVEGLSDADVSHMESDDRSDCSFRKICGISLEKHRDAVCVGIGVNIFRHTHINDVEADGSSRAFVRNDPVYLSDIAALDDGREEETWIANICDDVLSTLGDLYKRWLKVPFACFLEEYDACDVLKGHAIRIENMDGSIQAQGTVRGIDDAGRLLVEGETGSVTAVSSGEAHVVLK